MMKFRTITILFLMITAIGCSLILKGDKAQDYQK